MKSQKTKARLYFLSQLNIKKILTSGWTNLAWRSGQNWIYVYDNNDANVSINWKTWGFSNTYNPNYDTFNFANYLYKTSSWYISYFSANQWNNNKHSWAYHIWWRFDIIKVR